LGGLLVLFDEFSLFLQKYMAAQAVGKLQELLNGISKRPGKSAFLAFSQQDVDSVAETYAQGQRREDVKKELERLPKDKRARLFSLMESVLDSYLKQDEINWPTWRELPPVRAALVQARESVLEHFGKHYSNELQWNPQAFEQKVVKGCFPLHPLTTAILSIHNFESGAGENPRTALQFVRRAWQDLRQQPAQLPDSKPNFVFPVALVDFFGEQLSKKWYAAYRNTLETAPQSLSEEQRKVLQALFVQQAVGLKARAGEQIGLLSHLCGLEREDVKSVLKGLAAQKIIYSDSINKVSSLWPASTRPQEVEEVIQKAVEETPIDRVVMEKITSALQSLEISLNFGHASDWSPRQVARTTAMLTAEELKKQLQPYRSDINGIIEEGPRGLIVWLVAQSEEERIRLRQNAQSVLDEALRTADYPLPVVIILPKHAVPGLVDSARRLIALENLKTSERDKIGTVMYDREKGLAEINFKTSLDDLVGDTEHYLENPRNLVEYVLPSTYRASVQALKNLSLKSVVQECYRQAYAYRVEFYDQFPVGGKRQYRLRDASRKVSRWLLDDTARNGINSLEKKDIQYQISTFYLTQKWGLLAAETYTIQHPTLRALQQAWDLLEDTFKPGCSDVLARQALLTLLNPPYGHDYNTLTLLLSAWIGFHQHELRLSLSGKVVSLSQLKSFFDESKNPQDFLNRICNFSPLAISRSRLDEIFGQVNVVLEQIRQGKPFSVAEAQEALAKIEQTLANPRLPEAKREEVEQMRPRLEGALQKAQEYDQIASAWLGKLAVGDFDDLLQIRDTWKDLPALSLVSAVQPPLEELQKHWEAALQTALGAFCAKYANLNDLTDYKTQENQLKHARKALDQFPAFAQQVDEFLERLSQRRTELQKQESEKTVIAQINSMTPSAALQVLYEYREDLAKLIDLTPQTAARRDEKLRQIENRIRQFEQIAGELPGAVERVTQPSELRQQRDLLLRSLEQVQETRLYPSLLEVQRKIGHLETFFEKLRELNAQSQKTPDDLNAIESQIAGIETQFSIWLGPAQQALLDSKKHEIEGMRRQKVHEAQAWLQGLARRYKDGENPEGLIHLIETPPPFLDSENITRLTQLKQALQKRLGENVVLQIETLFRKIQDNETRRQCLARLQALMGE
jgi:hypothetical protein